MHSLCTRRGWRVVNALLETRTVILAGGDAFIHRFIHTFRHSDELARLFFVPVPGSRFATRLGIQTWKDLEYVIDMGHIRKLQPWIVATQTEWRWAWSSIVWVRNRISVMTHEHAKLKRCFPYMVWRVDRYIPYGKEHRPSLRWVMVDGVVLKMDSFYILVQDVGIFVLDNAPRERSLPITNVEG